MDTGSQLLLLLGLRRASRPASPSHPFGHGLQLYFWTFVVAVLVFGGGTGVSIVEGIDKVGMPHAIESPWVNYAVLGLALLFEGTVWIVAVRAFRASKGSRGWLQAVWQSKDPTVFTVLFEDSAAILGLLVALLGIWLSQRLDLPVLDGVASLAIGMILAGTAAFLAWECQSLLTGERARPEVRASIYTIVASEPGVVRPNEILTMHFGPQDVLVALSMDFEDRRSAADAGRAVTRIKAVHPVTRVFVEAQSLEAYRRNQAPMAEE